MSARDPREPPKDYAENQEVDFEDAWDPTGYYRRKAEHRAEMIPYLAGLFVLSLVLVFVRILTQENTMFGDLTTLATGVVIGLVLVQLYPPSARVGVWIVNKAKELVGKIRS